MPHARHRIALCISDLDVGGAEGRLVDLAIGLVARDFEPRVYCLGPRPADDARSLVPKLEAASIPVTCLGATRNMQAARVAWRLAGELRAARIDLAQTFLFHANLLGRVAAGWAGVRHVVSGVRVAERRYPIRLRLDRWTERLVERHVAVSRAVADFSVREGGLSSEKVLVIPNGVDLAAMDAASPIDISALGIASGRKYLLYVGRIDPQKRILEFVVSSQGLFDRLPNHDLLVAGDGTQAGELRRAADRSPFASRIHVLGWRGDSRNLLRSADLLILPTRWEGMPNVLLEAMAARLPLVANDVEGVREVLGEAASDQTPSSDDMQTFIDKVVAVASNDGRRLALGLANRQRVEREFTLGAMVDRYATLYRQLLSAGSQSRG